MSNTQAETLLAVVAALDGYLTRLATIESEADFAWKHSNHSPANLHRNLLRSIEILRLEYNAFAGSPGMPELLKQARAVFLKHCGELEAERTAP